MNKKGGNGSEIKLPIGEMNAEEFNGPFKQKYLENIGLSNEALNEIGRLFGVGDDSTGRINCDEYHSHGYHCVYHYSPMAGIVHRLIKEINRYKYGIKSIFDLDKERGGILSNIEDE